jgi:LIVCS family branched-chain amino acid:cation transporter
LACFLGVIIGALSVNAIIEIALPVLLLIYPLTIVLILLNVMPSHFRTRLIMSSVVVATLVFSLPDALKYVVSEELFSNIQLFIPLSKYGLGWVIPATLAFFGTYFYEQRLLLQKSSS